MECEKEIVVASTTTIAGLSPVQFELPIQVSALCNICVKIIYKEPLVVPILPDMIGPPDFVLIKPELPDKKKYLFVDHGKGLRYHTSKTCGEQRRKPLQSPHQFYGGMPEWMTDSLQNEDLKELVFWSDVEGKAPDPDNNPDHKDLKKLEYIKVHIVVGYDTTRRENATAGNGEGNNGEGNNGEGNNGEGNNGEGNNGEGNNGGQENRDQRQSSPQI